MGNKIRINLIFLKDFYVIFLLSLFNNSPAFVKQITLTVVVTIFQRWFVGNHGMLN